MAAGTNVRAASAGHSRTHDPFRAREEISVPQAGEVRGATLEPYRHALKSATKCHYKVPLRYKGATIDKIQPTVGRNVYNSRIGTEHGAPYELQSRRAR